VYSHGGPCFFLMYYMYDHLEYLYVKPAEYNFRKLSLPVYFLATPSANEASSIGKHFEHIKSNLFI